MPPKKKSKTEEEAKKEEDVKETEDDDFQEEEIRKEEEKEEEMKEDDDGGSARSKRKRRDSTTYEPEDFTLAAAKAKAKASPVVPGRGSKLADLKGVKASIEKCNPGDLPFAYRFLFPARLRVTKKDMKLNLLEFSGYLPPLPKGKKLSDEELEDLDEEYEVSG
jgi:hypothetical protein